MGPPVDQLLLLSVPKGVKFKCVKGVKGKPPGETREYGVGFAVKSMLLGALIPPTGGSERILTLCLNNTRVSVHLVSVYVPTLSAPQEVKDKFYDELEVTVKKHPKSRSALPAWRL